MHDEPGVPVPIPMVVQVMQSDGLHICPVPHGIGAAVVPPQLVAWQFAAEEAQVHVVALQVWPRFWQFVPPQFESVHVIAATHWHVDGLQVSPWPEHVELHMVMSQVIPTAHTPPWQVKPVP